MTKKTCAALALVLLFVGCDWLSEPDEPSGPVAPTPTRPTPPPEPTYNDTTGCLSVEWGEVHYNPGIECQYHYLFEFHNSCPFAMEVFSVTNAYGATREDVKRWAATFSEEDEAGVRQKASHSFYPRAPNEPIPWGVPCPGGDERPFVTACTTDTRDRDRCASGWVVE